MGGEDQRGGVGELVLDLFLELLQLILGVGHGVAEVLQRVDLLEVLVQDERQALLLVEDHGGSVGESLGGHLAVDELETRPAGLLTGSGASARGCP